MFRKNFWHVPHVSFGCAMFAVFTSSARMPGVSSCSSSALIKGEYACAMALCFSVLALYPSLNAAWVRFLMLRSSFFFSCVC